MGSSKKATVGYWYKMGLHMGICHGPVDSVMEIRVGDRAAWTGDVTTSGQISIDAENLFGGKEKEGGIVGDCDVMMGEPTQTANSYLTSKQAGPQPGYRGLLSLVFRGGKIAANNPYIKPWAVRIKRILSGWDGGSAWYPEKAPVPIIDGSAGGSGGAWLVTDGSGVSKIGSSGSWTTLTHDDPSGIVGYGLIADGYFYRARAGFAFSATAALSDLSTWTIDAHGGVSGDGGNMVAQGSYIYLLTAVSGQSLHRKAAGFGAWSVPYVGAESWAPSGAVVGSRLILCSMNFGQDPYYTTDFGASYTAGTNYSSTQVISPRIATDGTRLCVAFREITGDIKIIYTDDITGAWSGTVYTVPSSSSDQPTHQGMQYANGKWILITDAGKVAFSSNGSSWTAGASISGGVLHWAFNGTTIVVIKSDFTMVQSADFGASWTAFTGPTASDNVWVYWAGEPGAAPDPDIYAMNPAHIIYQCLTDRQWGLGYPSGKLDLASFTAAADTFYAEGMGLCLEWNQQDAIINFVQMVVDHAGAAIGEDPRTGQFRLKAIRADYTLGSLQEFSAAAGNIISLDGFDRASLTETVNEISVSYTDAATGKEGSVTVQQLANIQAQGAVVSQGRSYPGLPTLDLAVRVALRDLKAAASGLARVRLTVTRAGWTLAPGDVIRFVWPEFGITAMALRIARIDYGSLTSGAISLECIEDVFGLPANTYVKPPSIGWEAPDSTPIASTAVEAFEVPFRDLVQTMGQDDAAALPVDAGYLCAVALRPAGVPLNYDLRTKVGAAAYASADSGDWCPSATLSVAAAPLDTTLTLADVSDLDEIDVGSAVLLGTEICRVDAVDTTLNTLTVGRGCLDTVPAGWPIGTRVWAYDAFAAADDTQYSDGETVNAKFVTRTSSGVLSEGGSPADSVVMASRAIRPYPPGLLRFLDDLNTVTGLAYPVELAGALTASWAHRDRLLQQDQLIDENDASIGPEASTTYTVTYYQPPGTLVNTESALSGTSATPYTFPADGQAEIRVEASRSGYASWQSAKHIFDYYRYPRITTVAGEPRITDDGSARKVI